MRRLDEDNINKESDFGQGVANLYDRQERMAGYGPTFCDITWGAGGSTADLTLDIAAKMQNVVRSRARMLL